MKQVRVNMTTTASGTTAMLQELDGFDTHGNIYWKDIRPLEVRVADGKITVVLSQGVSEDE